MTDYELRIENDKVYLYYPLSQYGDGISKKELVMTKEVFIKCYEEWILKDKKNNNNTSDDCVSRQLMLDAITEIDDNINMDIYTNEVREIIKDLPPITTTHGTCKDCMHWKDSDGVYRRGINAENKCPINIKEVYEGEFYCKYFEKRNKVDGWYLKVTR